MSAKTEYLQAPDEIISGNGHILTPSEKAWQTAKDQAVAEAQKPFFKQLDEEMRALTDCNLSNGAARLFNLLCKCGWKKELGGMRNGVVGKILMDARRLAKICGGSSVNSLYHKTRPEKRDKRGKLIRAASETDGWIEELVKGGYIWIAKQPIANIQAARWPNIFNVACHVPITIQANLHLLESPPPDSCPTMWDRNSSAEKPADYGQSVKNGTDHHQNGGWPVGQSGDGPLSASVTAHHRNGGRAVTEADNGPSPKRITGRHRIDQQPVTGLTNSPLVNPVHLRETVEGKPDPTDPKVGGKGTPPTREELFSRNYPMPIFEPLDWGMFQSRRDKFAEAAIDLAKQERATIAADPLSKHPGEEKFHAAAAAVRIAYRDRIDLLKKFAAGQKVSQ